MLNSVEKKGDEELPIPDVWKITIKFIVKYIAEGIFFVEDSIFVYKISPEDMMYIKKNIDDYGERICELPEDSWSTSVHLWMGDHWELIVDLYTMESGQSDLALFIDVFEQDDGFLFIVKSVHVP